MKIVHLSTRDVAGGAAKAAFRLHSKMIKSGIESSMFVLTKERHGDKNIKTVSLRSAKIYSLVRGSVNHFLKKKVCGNTQFLFSIDLLGVGVSKNEIIRSADVVCIHWINTNFVTIPQIGSLLKLGKPVVWVLHDMWAMTGGCHYAFDCDRYVSGNCESCPELYNNFGKRVVSKFYKKKIKTYSQAKNLLIVTPSRWLGECAQKSQILGKLPIKVIPNVLDRSIFRKVDKMFARQFLGIDAKIKLVLFVAELGSNNPYKGWPYLQQALEKVVSQGEAVQALILGCDNDETITATASYKVHFVGRLFDEYSLSLVYNAADLFVTPSLADNLPNTVLESLSCGTPVVAFNVGGISDLITHKKNGYLANYKDANDLAIGISYILCNNITGSLDHHFDVDRIIQEYIQSFEYKCEI